MSLELFVVKPRKIKPTMQLLSARMIYKESRLPHLLKAETKFSKKNKFKRNKRRPPLPKPRLERKKCKCWIRLEPKR